MGERGECPPPQLHIITPNSVRLRADDLFLAQIIQTKNEGKRRCSIGLNREGKQKRGSNDRLGNMDCQRTFRLNLIPIYSAIAMAHCN